MLQNILSQVCAGSICGANAQANGIILPAIGAISAENPCTGFTVGAPANTDVPAATGALCSTDYIRINGM